MRRENLGLIVAIVAGTLALLSGCTPSSDQSDLPVGAPGEETVVVGTPTPPELLFTPLPPKGERSPIPTPRGRTPSAKTEQRTPTTVPKAATTQPKATMPPSPTVKASSTGTPQATQAAVREIKVSVRDNGLDPGSITLEVGRYNLTVENKGTALHSLLIKGTGVDARTDRIEPGRSVKKEITFSQAGKYEISCVVDDHKQKGESGSITVK